MDNIQLSQIKQQILENQAVKKFIKENQLGENFIDENLDVFFNFVVEQKNDETNAQQNNADRFIPQLDLIGDVPVISYTEIRNTTQKGKLETIGVYFTEEEKKMRLADFDREGRENALALSAKMINGFIVGNEKEIKGIYLYGGFGVGKTFLTKLVANELVDLGKNVVMIGFTQLVQELKTQFGKVNNRVSDVINRLEKAQVLIIDDLGADKLSEWSRDEVLSPILDFRMNNKLVTIISSNYDFELLEKNYLSITSTDNSPVRAARIMQRIRTLTSEVQMNGNNKRNLD